MLYKGYYHSIVGLLEIICDDNYLTNINIVKESGKENLNSIVKETKKQLDQYFKKERKYFDLPIDFTDDFKGNIYKCLYNIEYGSTITYGALAKLAGYPKAARATGSAMASNPIPIVVACHRVVRSDGLGNYGYGKEIKAALLKLEGAIKDEN